MGWLNRKYRELLAMRNNFPRVMDYPIEYAFTVNGIKYFKYVDLMNIPVNRAMSVLPYYEEMRMRTTREFLQLHTSEINKILTNKSTIDLDRLNMLNKQLRNTFFG